MSKRMDHFLVLGFINVQIIRWTELNPSSGNPKWRTSIDDDGNIVVQVHTHSRKFFNFLRQQKTLENVGAKFLLTLDSW
jgi:hypothetical protein